MLSLLAFVDRDFIVRLILFCLLIEALMIGVFFVRVRKKASAAECLVNYLQISILAVPQINDTSVASL